MSGVDNGKMKETESIGQGLNALGDVIAALSEKGNGKGDKHILYGNSKVILSRDRQTRRSTDDQPF